MISFAVAKWYLVSHDFVFYWVLEWGIEKYINFFAFDKSHLDDSLTEATMTGYLDDNATFTCFKFW